MAVKYSKWRTKLENENKVKELEQISEAKEFLSKFKLERGKVEKIPRRVGDKLGVVAEKSLIEIYKDFEL